MGNARFWGYQVELMGLMMGNAQLRIGYKNKDESTWIGHKKLIKTRCNPATSVKHEQASFHVLLTYFVRQYLQTNKLEILI